MYTIEKNVLPPIGRKTMKYPWLEMKPGESFAVEVNGEGAKVLASRLGQGGLHAFGKGNYLVRVNANRTEVRVWRLK